MTADYESIRNENVSRYGWDTAYIDLLGQLYSERTHFIFELIQNAEDAGATQLIFDLREDHLEVRHNGRLFTEGDVIGICGVAHSNKSADLTKIGKFGVGFKSVYAYTKTPHIYSGGERFRIEKYVQPHAIPALGQINGQTLFVFPFDRADLPPARAAREVSNALATLAPRTLLFLKKIERILIKRPQVPHIILERTIAAGPIGSSRHITISDTAAIGGEDKEWIVWQRDVHDDEHPDQRVEIAFQYEVRSRQKDAKKELARSSRSPLVVFFPTARETQLGFLIQGPYRTTPARDNIPQDDAWNQRLIVETAVLLADVLTELRDSGLLSIEVLQAMPLDVQRFQPGSMFRPIFDAVRDCMMRDKFVPVAGSGYGRAPEIRLPRAGGLRDLLTPPVLADLYGADSELFFVDESITADRTTLLWQYLRDEVGAEELTADGMVSRVTGQFLAARSDQWMARLYAFLSMNPALSRAPRYVNDRPGVARSKPIIRLADGSQVYPFQHGGRPAAYLPGTIETAFPTVRRAVAADPAARRYLESLGFTAPDVVTEVLDLILPRYDGLSIGNLDAAEHQADLERIMTALDKADASRRRLLNNRIHQAAFLIGENAATGKQTLKRPADLYARSPELEMYFAGNEVAWFISPRYQRWSEKLHSIGVRKLPAVHTRRPAITGYVTIVEDHGWHQRGLDGFDPDAYIDGLDFALQNPNTERSEYVWNVLLAPNRQLLAGTVESSTRQVFTTPIREEKKSSIGVAASSLSWLPAADGTFLRPAELSLDDLSVDYKRDETLAAVLGMVQPVVEEASRRLGLPPDFLRGLSENPDLVAKVQAELRELTEQQKRSAETRDSVPSNRGSQPELVDYSTKLSDAFSRPATPPRERTVAGDEPPASGTVGNPEFRRERVQESITEDKESEPARHERFRHVSRRVWDGKDSAVRQFLSEQYRGQCQICNETFPKRDSTPYFEGLYLVSRVEGRWIDRPGNVICLCATCCAKFQHGSVVAPDIIQQIVSWRTKREGGSDATLILELCDDLVEITFTEKHLLDLQEILRSQKTDSVA